MHVDAFVRGLGNFVQTPFVATDERTTRKFPLILTTGRILSQYNVGAQTRRTENTRWVSEDVLEMHQADAEPRGIVDGGWVNVTSRVGETQLRVSVTDRVPPGVVYTTFHFPESGANVITTDYSDWATNCPEYKVTAVEVRTSTREHERAAAATFEGHDQYAHLALMLNQIAANAGGDSEPQKVERVALHVRSFWAPTMVRDLEAARAAGTVTLSMVAAQALDAVAGVLAAPNRV